ncbi:chromosome partitioning protein ParB [Trichocoleus sp. FACHB-591]|uniref:chromosome partitioning protein ParB n=1 Tax=Trichocoleus sp. FACHB-591 TaxID=2692872 RepID=UPI0016872EC9|nr:chromosome partitioning protein ParB [Trichocoleus sp. FACHB-591]MBD2096201.1 chromosome partitioning protein ParB [Trichocoleus sp. FACHB-591]
MVEVALVDVKNISSSVSRSKFSESELELLAQMILDIGGLVSPVVLKPVGPERYAVIEGDLEYYAAVRAKEINPRKGEMVNALIVSPKYEEIASRQIKATKKDSPPNSSGNINSNEFEIYFKNFEIQYEKRLNQLRDEYRENKLEIIQRIDQLEHRIPEKIHPLDAFNSLSQTDLTAKLRSAGVSPQKAATISEAALSERKKKKFESLMDVSERLKEPRGKKMQKMLGEKKLLNIIDSWIRA